ncbi:tyrosine-protein phosphatase non-receptor type 23b isoform X2 [Chanos chanos]|nr:tyrosine-protein phosphatase non-receptor type 23-like isoform X2 [Chanos chanos]
MDNRTSEEGMKVSCTHFQCSAGAFSYMRDHYNHNYSPDTQHQALSVNISLMLAQAQECLWEKSLLDNRKNFLIARISAQVWDYYKECVRVLDSSECVLGKNQKEWTKLITMKMNYFSAITHLHMGKLSEEQQKFGEAVAYFQSSLDKLNEAIRLSKGQPDSVQEALRFTMDVIGGKFNSAKKDNDFIYHEPVPDRDTFSAVKGAPLVKPLHINPADPSITGPDLFSKLVPIATHEASSLYSEEKAKLLRQVMAKIDSKNQTLQQFLDSLGDAPVDDVEKFSSVPDVLLEKCAALSVRPDTVESLVQAMQALSGVYTDAGASVREVQAVLEEDEAGERSLMEVLGGVGLPPRPQALRDAQKELQRYENAHQAASQTNAELHRAMEQHIPNLRLLQGPLEQLRISLPQPQLSQDDEEALQRMKRILDKVDEMQKQRISLENQLRELVLKDDITAVLVTTERDQMKRVFEEQMKKYDQLTGYIDQNLTAQDNILRALTDANVQYAPVRKSLAHREQQWNSCVQSLIGSFEAFQDLMKKAEEGREFFKDLDRKTTSLLTRTKTLCAAREEERLALLEREIGKAPLPRPSTQKPLQAHKTPDTGSGPSSLDVVGPSVPPFPMSEHLPRDLRSLPPDVSFTDGPRHPHPTTHPGPFSAGPTHSPLSWPPGTTVFAPSQPPNPTGPFMDSRAGLVPPQASPVQPFPLNQATGIRTRPSHPSALQCQPGPPGGLPPIPPQPNPRLDYRAAPWQPAAAGAFPAVSGGYVIPPRIGQQPPGALSAGLPVSQPPGALSAGLPVSQPPGALSAGLPVSQPPGALSAGLPVSQPPGALSAGLPVSQPPGTLSAGLPVSQLPGALSAGLPVSQPPGALSAGLPVSQGPATGGRYPPPPGQQPPPFLPTSSSMQQFGPQTHSLPRQGVHTLPPGAALPGQVPGPVSQYQPPFSTQSVYPCPVYQPGVTPPMQPQPGPGSTQTQPVRATGPNLGNLLNQPQLNQPQPFQNQPRPHVGYVPPHFHVMTSHQLPLVAQTHPQVPLSHPGTYQPKGMMPSQPQIPPGILPSHANMFPQALPAQPQFPATFHPSQPVQFNAIFDPAGASSYPNPNPNPALINQPPPASQSVTQPPSGAPVTDIPIASTEVPNVAPIPQPVPPDTTPPNQTSTSGEEPLPSLLESQDSEADTTSVQPNGVSQIEKPVNGVSDSSVCQVSLRDRLDNLSLASQEEASKNKEDKSQDPPLFESNVGSLQPISRLPESTLSQSELGKGAVHQPEGENGLGEPIPSVPAASDTEDTAGRCPTASVGGDTVDGDTVDGESRGSDSTAQKSDDQQGEPKSDPLNDLDPLWTLHKT